MASPAKFRRRVAGFVVVLGTVACLAEESFKSPKAVDATAKYNADMKRLADEYRHKVVDARRAYLAGLKEALKDAAKVANPNPDEIARISAKIKQVDSTLQSAPDESDAAIKAEDLVGKTFVYSAFSSRLASEVTLEKNGVVKNGSPDYDTSWRLEGGRVLLINDAGKQTSGMEICRIGTSVWFCETSNLHGTKPGDQFHALFPAP